jgi:putative hemolysin
MRFVPTSLSFICLTILVMLLTGCSDNRASDYCSGLGYSERFQPTYGGQVSLCVFPDSRECEIHDFLSGHCGQEFSYCVQQGYALESGRSIARCVFNDGSTCDEYEYFRGYCGPES